jgi:hypothetical protein
MAYDQFILFGDSITQESGTQERGFGFARALQNGWYIGCSFLFLFDADLILYSLTLNKPTSDASILSTGDLGMQL